MMKMSQKINKVLSQKDLESLFPIFKNGSKNHIITACPFCGKENHFYINRKTQLFDCKKCGEDGNIFKLLFQLNKTYLIGDFKSIDRSKIKSLENYKESFDEDEKVELVAPKRKLPIGFNRLSEHPYLINRKLTKRNFEENRIGITNLKPSLKNYIIFVVDEEDECKGYLSRYTKPIPLEKKKKILRYNNDKGCNFSHLLYGWNKVTNETKTIILVEGLIDALTLDNFLGLDNIKEIKACATFGKKISSTQIYKMLEKGIENVILIFDYDAVKEMKKFSKRLDSYFNVLVGFTFLKDINDSTDIEIENIFKNLKTPREFDKKVVKML